MPIPNSKTKIITGSAWVAVFVIRDGKTYRLGLCQNASYNESFGLQDANVIGFYGPISIDAQQYSCTLNIGTYLPEKKNSNGEAYPDGGDTTIADLLKTRSEISIDGKGTTFDQMDFVNLATQEVINSFFHVIIESNSSSAQPNTYVTSTLQMRAIERLR